MKYLGIDYGEKRIGIAISDAEGKIAFPKIVLGNKDELIEKILNLCKEFEVDAIVIGESKDYKGEDNKINPQIISFKRELSKAVKLPISLEPEFLSSMQVEKTFGKTKMLDASAAAIILQTYMDKEKNRQIVKQKTIQDKEKTSTKDRITPDGKISYDSFKKVEMKVGKILSAEIIIGSDKLYKLSVDFDEGKPRQIVSGIAPYFSDSKILIGKKVAFVTNLEPRLLMGLSSNGMILAAKSEDKLALMEVPDFIKEGTQLN
jgi:putative transcription antitermination factor YqgF